MIEWRRARIGVAVLAAVVSIVVAGAARAQGVKFELSGYGECTDRVPGIAVGSRS